MFKYKNTTRFKIVVVIDSKVIVISPGDTYVSKDLIDFLGEFLILDDPTPRKKDKK